VRAQLTENLLKYGVLRCIELTELYFGWRMVTSLTENYVSVSTSAPFQVLGQDPRRIRYEIITTNSGMADILVTFNDSLDNVNNIGTTYGIPAGETLIIERSFLTDLDAVTIPVWGGTTASSIAMATRETFLTPAPVDELPLG